MRWRLRARLTRARPRRARCPLAPPTRRRRAQRRGQPLARTRRHRRTLTCRARSCLRCARPS
eukprot:8963335-Alexandrium_andersonii.AAC.1